MRKHGSARGWNCKEPLYSPDQEEEEWIVLLQGEASLLIEKDGTVEEVHLTQGDLLVLEKHQRHRVAYTSAEPPCIWLCWFL